MAVVGSPPQYIKVYYLKNLSHISQCYFNEKYQEIGNLLAVPTILSSTRFNVPGQKHPFAFHYLLVSTCLSAESINIFSQSITYLSTIVN